MVSRKSSALYFIMFFEKKEYNNYFYCDLEIGSYYFIKRGQLMHIYRTLRRKAEGNGNMVLVGACHSLII